MEFGTLLRKIAAGLLVLGGRREAAARILGVSIGADCRIYNEDFGSEPFLVSIGDRVTITAGVRFVTHDGALSLVRDSDGRRYHYARIKIGNDVFVGVDSIILPGVEIGNRVVVGAGTLVNASIPDDTVAAGVPVRRIGSFNEFRDKALLVYTKGAQLNRRLKYRERILAVVRAEYRANLR